MHRHVPMALLESVVLPDIMEVISADHDGALHLHLDDGASEDSTSDGDAACEGTLLVDVLALDGLAGNLEAETNISGVPDLLLG